jgi:FSR family fosmidomycin resistance protein-like MFS transporter
MGPAIVTPALLYMGLTGSLVLTVPAVILFTLLTLNSSRMRAAATLSVEQEKAAFPARATAKNEWGMFWWLTVALIFRSILFTNINTFLPLYWVNVLGQPMAAGGVILTVMFVAGAISTLIGGQLADRFGLNKVTKIGAVLMIPSLYLFTKATNPVLATICVIFIAYSSFTITTPMIILGQKYLPGKVGFASGVTMGLSVSIGGMVAPFVGRYADTHGLLAAFQFLAFLPLIPAFVILTLKQPAVDKE